MIDNLKEILNILKHKMIQENIIKMKKKKIQVNSNH